MAQNKQYKEGPIEFLPTYWSHDPTILEIKKRVAQDCTRLLPASVDDLGRVTGNGIRSNFYGLQHVNGFPMRPATFPVTDNRPLRESKGLSNSFVEPWHQDVLRTIVKLMCTGLTPTALRLRVGSSAMLPFLETKMEPKKEIARNALSTAQESAAYMQKGDYITPWVKNQCGGAFQTVYRRQSSDAITYEKGVWTAKDRPVADLAYAISGGKEGTYLPASKSFGDEVNFKVPDGFFRERNRTAHGGPLGINAQLMPIAQAIRNNIYEKYGYTYHVTTRQALQDDIRSDWKFIINADVASHDTFWPTFTVDTICEGMSDAGIQDWWLTLYKTSKKLPMYVTDVDDGVGNILLGDWRKPDLHPGLTSGVATTDLDGSIVMTWVYFLIQVTHTYPDFIPLLKEKASRERIIDSYLRGKLPFRLKDKSDDAAMGWTDPVAVSRAVALQDKMKKGEQISPYMVVTYEHGGAYLGSIFLYPESKLTSGIVLIGNALSLVINQLSPEYGVQSGVADRSRTKRPYPGLAWDTLAQAYGSAPAYGVVMESLERAWYDVRHESYRGLRERMLEEDRLRLAADIRRQSANKLTYDDFTALDKEVLARPDLIQHRVSPNDVSPGLLEMLFQGLGVDEVEPYFKKAYHG